MRHSFALTPAAALTTEITRQWYRHVCNLVTANPTCLNNLCTLTHRRTRRGSRGCGTPPDLKIFRVNSVFIASASCSKILTANSIFNTVKIFRANSVFRASVGCSKILNVKSIFHTVKNFRTHAVFQGKRKLLRNPECKKYIQHSKKLQGTLCFSGQAQVAQNPECKKYIQYSEKFQGNSVFSGQAQVAQKSWTVKKFSIQCIFTWGWSM